MTHIPRIVPRKLACLVAGALAAMLQAGGAHAISLMQAYDAALQNDPTFRSATHEYDAGQENRILGRSALLPNISASYSNSKVNADVTYITDGIATKPRELEYTSKVATVQLRQPIINFEGLARYKQGIAQTDYASAIYQARKQELIVRVAAAYTDALFASTQLRLAEVQRDVYAEQQSVNNRLFEKGEGTKTDMLETQSRLDLSEAQLLEAQDVRRTSLATLSALVGAPVTVLDELAPEFRIAPVGQDSYEDWKEIALRNNPDIRAQQFAVEAARQDVNKNRAGHAPRVDFVSSYSKSTSDSITTINQDSTVRAIGIQVSIPLYSGGYVSALTRQSVAGQEKAKSDLQTNTDKVLVELQRQYSALVSSTTRLRALDKAVASGQLLITATEQSIKGGVRINLDLLNARQQLFTSQRDLAQARYNYLLSLTKMRAAAGVLSADDVREVATYFR